MKQPPAFPQIGVQTIHKPGQWVQTERKAHEAAMTADLEIPPHILAKDGEQEPPDPDAVFT